MLFRSLVMGIISLITGILILRNPHTAVETIIRIIGYILIAAGISAVLGYLFDKNKGLSSYGDIIIGVMILAIGLVLAFSPGTFIGFVGWIFSIILAIHGISDIIEGVSSKKYDDLKWTHTLLMRSEEHTSELQSRSNLVCRLLLEKKNV